MTKRSYDDFSAAITQRQSPLTPQALQDLIAETVNVDIDDIDEDVTGFAYSRIELAYRTGDIEGHLQHLYNVLQVFEAQVAQE